MKKMVRWMTAVLMVVVISMVCGFAFGEGEAASDVQEAAIDEAHFPDPVFREYVRQFDADGDGVLNEEEILTVTMINCEGFGIKSLEGIEFFTELHPL